MVAKATPCGKTITAPVKPAIISALIVSLLTSLNQFRKGNRDKKFIIAVISVEASEVCSKGAKSIA